MSRRPLRFKPIACFRPAALLPPRRVFPFLRSRSVSLLRFRRSFLALACARSACSASRSARCFFEFRCCRCEFCWRSANPQPLSPNARRSRSDSSRCGIPERQAGARSDDSAELCARSTSELEEHAELQRHLAIDPGRSIITPLERRGAPASSARAPLPRARCKTARPRRRPRARAEHHRQ